MLRLPRLDADGRRANLMVMTLPLRTTLVGSCVALLMLGAGYLYAVRGEAILIDLAAMGRAMFCM